jgi:hypothetical protein
MAITVGVGLQGAGKTYYAVAEIWKHIKKMHAAELNNEDYKYKKIYTNIEGFIPNKYVEHLKFAELENLWKWENEQYQKFENVTAPAQLPQIEFNLKKRKKKQSIQEFDPYAFEESELHPQDDIEIITASDEKIFKTIQNQQSEELESDYITFTRPYFEEYGFTNCLIVIDEAHNHFKKSLSGALKRLASYHRHYDQDFILVTQDLNQLPRYITNLTVFTFKATSPAIRLKSNLFTYKIYSGGYISFRDDNKLETKRLKANPYIFGLYSSGSVKITSSAMYRVMLGILGMILLLVGGFMYFTSHLGEGQKTLKVTTVRPAIQHTKSNLPEENLQRYSFVQIGSRIIYDNKRTDIGVFESMLSKQDKFIFSSLQMDGTRKRVYLLSNKTLIKIGVKKNEVRNINTNNPFNLGSPAIRRLQ